MADDNAPPSETPKTDADQDVEMEDIVPGNASIAIDRMDARKSRDLFDLIHNLSKYLCTVEEDGEELASGFQRVPNRRLLPDYFDIIEEPVAFSTIRAKIQKKQYTSFSEFVKDVSQICHNAQVYNRPSAPIFGAAERLREIFQQELQKLVVSGAIAPEDATLPDLGELPPGEESPSRGSDVEDGDEDEGAYEEEDDEGDGEEDEEADDDDSDEEDGPHQRQDPDQSIASGIQDSYLQKGDISHKRRGRPPMVLTPLEARISAIIKGLRKLKDAEGIILISSFEKLPDKAVVPGYYHAITNPLALDNIKKKAKRKKYKSVDQLMSDIELMLENAKLYNEDDSEVYRAAVELQREARILADQERAKPDDNFRDEDGKLALAEIQHNGDTWRVGDWVHIRNPNDLAKPIVAQIFRTWQDRAGQKWINACWYYRPEQTVHRYDKHFFEYEVVKTGQYRDHQIREVIDRCFVMFVTRFNRGRPRGFPPGKDVYVCESRYNEDMFRFNKIKTWASCVPDEVREKDYEMDLFETPQRMRKVPSPIKHLLREDAKEADSLPKPTWGSSNAPPIVGAVHRRPPQPNESPPPEPTPPLAPATMVPEIPSGPLYRSSIHSTARDAMGEASVRNSRASFSATITVPSAGHHHTPMASFQPVTPMPGGPQIHQTPVPIPHPTQQATQPQVSIRPAQYQFSHQQPDLPQSFAPNYAPQLPIPLHHQSMPNPRAMNYNPPHLTPNARPTGAVMSGSSQPHTNMYNPPRPPEVYSLPETLNDTLPSEVRQSFQHDSAGRILFFTAAPLDRTSRCLSPASAGLGHSIQYLAGRDAWLAEREEKRKKRDGAVHVLSDEDHVEGTYESVGDAVTLEAAQAVEELFLHLDGQTNRWETDAGLEGWRKPLDGRSPV